MVIEIQFGADLLEWSVKSLGLHTVVFLGRHVEAKPRGDGVALRKQPEGIPPVVAGRENGGAFRLFSLVGVERGVPPRPPAAVPRATHGYAREPRDVVLDGDVLLDLLSAWLPDFGRFFRCFQHCIQF